MAFRSSGTTPLLDLCQRPTSLDCQQYYNVWSALQVWFGFSSPGTKVAATIRTIPAVQAKHCNTVGNPGWFHPMELSSPETKVPLNSWNFRTTDRVGVIVFARWHLCCFTVVIIAYFWIHCSTSVDYVC